VAGKMGISASTLLRWSKQREEICDALKVDKETADFLVEDVLFEKSLKGDTKAYEFWLKHRMPGRWGAAKASDEDTQSGLVELARLINNPVVRGEEQ